MQRTLTILVIDDNRLDRERYRKFFEEGAGQSYEILEAETGEQGLSIFSGRDVDCVVLDYNLPEMDGLEILGRLRELSGQREIPVVVATGAGSEAVAVEVMKRGSHDYVVKADLTSEALRRAVHNAVEKVALRREISERKAALAESRRQQIELKDRFLRHVSHELRTPLAAVDQFLSLVLDGIAGDITAQQREFLGLAFKNVKQLGAMIGDLLDVARAESGKLRVEARPTALGPLVVESVETLKEYAAQSGLSLGIEIQDELPEVLADTTRTRQVLSNLIENAVKFTPEGGSITVSARVDPDDPAFVRCSVSDTGCGISEAGTARVFEQLHQEQTQEYGRSRHGLGLGLSICKSLVARQGGRIWVESVLGKGSTFHFTLPVFSLTRVIGRTLVHEGRVRDVYGVLRVTLAPADPNDSGGMSVTRSRQVHHILRALTYYPRVDVVLPRMGHSGLTDTHHMLLATDGAGLRAAAHRLQQQLEYHDEIGLWKVTVDVQGALIESAGSGREVPLEEALREHALRLERLLDNPSLEGIST